MNNCHVLATCLNPDLLANTLLVFKSIRVGFPTANIHVFGNGLDAGAQWHVENAAAAANAHFHQMKMMAHGAWIEALIRDEERQFWICDTDIVFHAPVEHWFQNPLPNQLFAGRYEPDFNLVCLAQTVHVARLHPSLMWFNPRPLRAAIRAWPIKHPFFNSVEKTLFQWTFVPTNGSILFYDTCAGLYHALGGIPFNREQNEAFSHKFAGTYRTLLGLDDAELRAHEIVCKACSPPWPTEVLQTSQ